MLIYYLDTSAVLKLYFIDEAGTEFMRILLDGATPNEGFYISSFVILEFNAAIGRRLNDTGREETIKEFSEDVDEIFRTVQLNEYMLVQALAVLENHRLRAGDAIHLATALSVAADADNEQVYMVTSDHELLAAASAAGIGAIDPQSDEAIDGLLHIRAQ